MSFSEEFNDLLMLTNKRPRFFVCKKFGGYFECVKSIVSFSCDKVVLQLCDGELLIEGENLSIKKCVLGDVCISGKISRVTVK